MVTRITTASLIGLVLSSVPWYLDRMTDRSDEPLGWIALGTLLVSILWIRPNREISRTTAILLITAGLAVVLGRPWIPELIYAAAVLSLLLISVTRQGLPPSGIALGLLSLPVLATLDFYLGFPLRMAAGWVAAEILSLFGSPVSVSGIRLVGEGFEVMIDRPCAGLRYLWFGWYAAAVIGIIRQLRGWQFVIFSISTSVILFAANITRIAILFVTERAGFVGGTVHESIGLAVFGLSLLPLIVVGSRLGSPSSPTFPRLNSGLASRLGANAIPTTAMVVAFCTVAHLRPLNAWVIADESEAPPASVEFVPPTDLLGTPLIPLRATPSTFGGFFQSHRIQPRLFSIPGGLALLRQTRRPSRAVHPADDCFRGVGFTVDPLPLWRDPFERTWRCFRVNRNGETFLVRQIIISADGTISYPDISQWYWNALRYPEQTWNIWTVVRKPARVVGS